MNNDSFLPIEMQNPFTRANSLRTKGGFARNRNAQLPASTVSWYEVELDNGPSVPNQLPAPAIAEKVDYNNFDSKTEWAPVCFIQPPHMESNEEWNDGRSTKEEEISKEWEMKNKQGNEKLLKDLENDPERMQMLKDLEDGKFMPMSKLIEESKKHS